ncbi:hypothetical protein MMC19_000066 [Ptychographa xylographoides]|nr:hypothetical protein [Ptychographa xylographoides]
MHTHVAKVQMMERIKCLEGMLSSDTTSPNGSLASKEQTGSTKEPSQNPRPLKSPVRTVDASTQTQGIESSMQTTWIKPSDRASQHADPQPSTVAPRQQSWSAVTSDKALTDHLLSLYCNWVHPVFMVIDVPGFMKSYHDGFGGHCSSFLFNAICAVACNFLHRSNALPQLNELGEILLLQDRFVVETYVQEKLAPQDDRSTAQAYTIMKSFPFMKWTSTSHSPNWVSVAQSAQAWWRGALFMEADLS